MKLSLMILSYSYDWRSFSMARLMAVQVVDQKERLLIVGIGESDELLYWILPHSIWPIVDYFLRFDVRSRSFL